MAKSNNVRSEDMKTPLAVIAYAHNLFDVQERDNGKKQYGCTLLFPKSADISALRKLAGDTAVAKWGDKTKQLVEAEILKIPFLDGDGKQGKHKETGEPHKGFPGHWFIRCVSGQDFKPKVWDRKRNPIFEKSDVPSGSKGYAVVNCFAWENDDGGKGVTFGISHFQLVEKAEGDAVLGGGGGGPDPDKFFEKIEDEGDAPESTKDGKGAEGLFG